MRVALLVESAMILPSHEVSPFVAALRTQFSDGETFAAGDDHAAMMGRVAARRSDFDLVLSFLYFRRLRHMSEALKAVGLPVVMIEYDAHANFNPAGSIYGLLTEFLGKARIDLLVVSGRRWCDDLRRLGPEVLYLPKAAPASFLTRGNHGSGAFCAFGSVAHGQYAERAALFNAIRPTISIDVAQTGLDRTLATLRAAITARHDGPVVHRLRFPYPDMATLLAWYSGCIICDRGLGEPMIKHFESAALGVAPVRDDEAEGELEALGYRDEESMVVYRSRQDLFDKLAHYHRHRSDLERIQAGARAVSGRHTWEERARTFHHALAARF